MKTSPPALPTREGAREAKLCKEVIFLEY